MVTRPQPRASYVFGPFQVNAATGELFNGGTRIRLGGQPFKMLMLLLSQPGELVSREELRKEIWGEETFVDFDHGLHAGMNKLRRALNDSAEVPRYIETVPGRGYRFIGRLVAEQAAVEQPAAPAGLAPFVEPPPALANVRRAWLVLGASILVSALFWLVSTWQQPESIWKLTRMTSSAGLSDAPALSPDGKLLAYSSDQNPEGYHDLYLKQVGSGQTTRLTFDAADDTTPDFSPDGSRIVFWSGRDGGGIYEIPTAGGPVRLVARDGLDPKYSPDGREIAYWTGAASVGETVPGSGELWVVALDGGAPRRVGSEFTSARHPIWAPDGKELLVVGYQASRGLESTALDWWLVPLHGGAATKTGAYDVLKRAGLPQQDTAVTPVPGMPQPGCWSKTENKVSFSRIGGDTRNIWQLRVSPKTGRVEGELERLTTGTGNEMNPSCGGDAFVFASTQVKSNLWSVPLDASEKHLERIAQEPNEERNPSLSKDGKFLAFLSTRSGPGNVWLRELATGKEQAVAPSSLVQGYPTSNASGNRVAYVVYENKEQRVGYVSAPGETPYKVCADCIRITDWSRDEKNLLVFGNYPYQINLVDIATLSSTPVVKHPTYNLLYGKFSPDNRWISFTARTQASKGRLLITPYTKSRAVDEHEWIPLAEAGADDYAVWSPDGSMLYYTSSADGYACLWGQKLDLTTHRPSGEAFAVRHFHGSFRFSHKGISLADGRIAIALLEKTGDIWMMSRSKPNR